MRYFFEIQYHGGRYHGWQFQANAVSVQQVVEEALGHLMKTPTPITGSGRTDTGVHCVGQYFHADMATPIDTDHLAHRLNAFLPHDIAIKQIRQVRDNAHARYDAVQRSYVYKITESKSPLYSGLACHYFKSVDIRRMNQASELLPGEQDFESFSKVKTDVGHFICKVTRSEWKREGDLLCYHISANRFLRGMVRALVGTMLDVGTGKTSLPQFEKILASRDRKMAGMNAPPEGLYLSQVVYPDDVFL